MRQLDGITDSMDMSLSTPGDSEGQGSLVCSITWVGKQLDMTEKLNKNNWQGILQMFHLNYSIPK